jgi:hypothetical protein
MMMMYGAPLLTLALSSGNGQPHVPAMCPQGNTFIATVQRLGGPQSPPGHYERENYSHRSP